MTIAIEVKALGSLFLILRKSSEESLQASRRLLQTGAPHVNLAVKKFHRFPQETPGCIGLIHCIGLHRSGRTGNKQYISSTVVLTRESSSSPAFSIAEEIALRQEILDYLDFGF
jgi:hypothetical protein